MTSRLIAALALACAVVTTGCSDEFSLTEPISSPPAFASLTAVETSPKLVEGQFPATTRQVSAVFGPYGGTLTLRSDKTAGSRQAFHSLTVPAGAVPNLTRFVMTLGDTNVIAVDLSADDYASRGSTLAIVGESGSGKSAASLAIMGLHDRRAARIRGVVRVGGQDVVAMSEEEVRLLRGRRMATIFQDPLTALHPYFTIGRQIAEAYRVHNTVSAATARARAVDLLGRVGIPHPVRSVDAYPHQLSGGMRQRAMIAMALSCDPDLLIADEPTTALDVTVQAQILDLMLDLQREFGSALILITHDLGVVARMADDVLVMYAGRVAESGTAEQLLRHPQHPYTWGLLRSMPSLHGDLDVPLVPISGSPPSLIDVPPGCPFHPRCPFAGQNGDRCFSAAPPLTPLSDEPEHRVACHLQPSERRALFGREVTDMGVAP